MKNFTITLLSISLLFFIFSCTQNTGQMSFTVNFPKTSKVLTQAQKTELKKKIAIKNSEFFTEEEIKELFGEIEVIIK